MQCLRLLEQSGRCGARGEGATILDVCCGKGLTSVLLSFLLPASTIILYDSNGAMDLAHIAVRPNLRFVHLDLFAASALHVLSEGAANSQFCIAIGTHLCGALTLALSASLCHPGPVTLALSPALKLFDRRRSEDSLAVVYPPTRHRLPCQVRFHQDCST